MESKIIIPKEKIADRIMKEHKCIYCERELRIELVCLNFFGKKILCLSYGKRHICPKHGEIAKE